MATPSGLGVSTGIGKGEAQVFAPVKSEYFKNKANLALKERDKQEKAFVDIGSAPVFNPDTEEYKQELAKVRQFYRDNQRSILEGDFDTKLKLNQLTSGLTQWAANSNAQGKLWTDLKKKAASGETNFYQKDLDNLTKYYNTPFSQRQGMQIGLRAAFDTDAFLQEGVDRVADLPFIDQGYDLESIETTDGKLTDIIVNSKTQDKYSLDDIVDKMFLGSNTKFSEEQVNSKITRDQTKDYLKKFLETKTSNRLAPKGMIINNNTQIGGDDEVSAFNLTPNDVTGNMYVPYGQGSVPGYMGMNNGKVTVQRQTNHNTTIKYKGVIPTNAIFASGSYYFERDGEKEAFKGTVEPGEKTFNLKDANDGIEQNVPWQITTSGIFETFKDYKFSKDKGGSVDVSGYPIDEASKNSNAFKARGGETERRFYATLQSDDQVVRVPYHVVAPTVNKAYRTKADKKERLRWYNETKDFLIKNNYKQAYKDFTGRNMPKRKSTSTSKITPGSTASLAKKILNK